MISINKEPAPRPPHAAGTGWRARIAAWARGPTLMRDITLVLIVKLILLMSLKYAFFNHPQAEHMSLPPAVVAEKLLSVPAPASTEGDHHDK
ncbi:cytochrome oxidase putative small subunit CydP [Burkholderia sp. BCC1993]|uniref:cytochrome oxidase putative small subunit CydP n=1 Tax=Burkholderia sp. BCC1993 TaxID=2817444 RepID=UPI0039F0CBED